MRKRKVDLNPAEATIPPASSKEFTSLVSQYSYSAAKANDLNTTPSTRVTPPKTSKKQKIQLPPPSPSKGRNPGYAPPSTYAHIPTPDLDRLAHNLILLFIGLNPGIATALANHGFAGATNKFWPLLHSSGITTLRHTCEADRSLPALYRVGITNLIPRPTRCASELSKQEMLSNVDVVEEKICKYKPLAVCVVGKGIWDAIYERKHSGQKVPKDFEYGWQLDRMGVDEDWPGALCFVTPSTSGRVAAYSREFQEILWKELGEWVRQERDNIKTEEIDGGEQMEEKSPEIEAKRT